MAAPQHLHHTASMWLTVSGLAVGALLRRRRTGGLMLLTVGLGYAGVLWQRWTGCDLRHIRRPDPQLLEADQLLGHALIGYLGYRWLTGTSTTSTNATLR